MEHIIDIGINLMHRSFSADKEEIMIEAAKLGVTPLIITGTELRSSEKAALFAAKHNKMLYSTAGIHPHDAKTCNETTIEKLKKLAEQKQVVAIGECGLDYDRNFSSPETQRYWFEEQIKLAEKMNMPLFLHERAAHNDFLKILSKYPEAAKRSVVHCFTGTALEANDYLALGCTIGITGWICDKRRNASLRDALKVIPLNRLMIETDAPFLLPKDYPESVPNQRNEPKFLWHILNRLAAEIGSDPTELAKETYQNTVRFFKLEVNS